jgi:hypothetical protein
MKSRQAFAQDVLSQAVGTLLAAGVIFVIGKATGFLPGVNWGAVVPVALAVLGVAISLVGVANGWSVHRKQKQAARKRRVEQMLRNMTAEENVAINAYTDEARWNNLDPERKVEFEALIVQMLTRDA